MSKNSGSAKDTATTAFYQEFLVEREELLRHKWLMSEREDRDVGFEVALLDWAENHRSEWRRGRNEVLFGNQVD